jgi:hypothetical protein
MDESDSQANNGPNRGPGEDATDEAVTPPVDREGSSAEEPEGSGSQLQSKQASSSSTGAIGLEKAQPPDRLHFSSERIPVELYKQEETKTNWERRGKIAADFGPLILGLASLIISGIALFLSFQTSVRQYELKTQELNAADNERRARFLSELNDKVFSELKDDPNQDPAKKTLAAIRLSTYGEAAFPSIQAALGVREPTVRKGAVEVVSQMFQSGVIERSKLFANLLKWNSDARNPFLRRSALDCSVHLIPYLDEQEKQQITSVLKERLKHEDCSQHEGADVILLVAVFIGNSPSSEAAKLLLGIASDSSCLNVAPRRQAIDYLPTVASRLSTSDRAELLDSLRKLKERVPEDIRGNIESAINQIAAM